MTTPHWRYNGKDTIATFELQRKLHPLLDRQTKRVYEAEMGLQGAFLGVQLRGILVDLDKRKEMIKLVTSEAQDAAKEVEAFAGHTMTGKKGSISQKKLKTFLYEEQGLLPLKDKDQKITTNKEALKKIQSLSSTVRCNDKIVPHGKCMEIKRGLVPMVEKVLLSRDLSKQVSTLKAPLHRGNRMRFTLVSGGTDSYRISSHKSHDGKGVNIQNQDPRLRVIYVPDKGFTMGEMDQERAESLIVAYVSGDEKYIRAHHEGNTHALVASMIWPELPWPVGDEKALVEYAKNTSIPGWIGPFVPGKKGSLYDISKRVQHGQNNGGSFKTVSRTTGLNEEISKDAVERYHVAFPGIRPWHKRVVKEAQETGQLVYPGDYRRVTFGRLTDPHVHRALIASIPQSIVAWTNHIVFVRLYYELEGPNFNLLAHGHDAELFQFRNGMEDYYLPKLKVLSKVEWDINGQKVIIPWDFTKGHNWKELGEWK